MRDFPDFFISTTKLKLKIFIILLLFIQFSYVSKAASAPLYTFSSFTFTNCGSTGINGPDSVACGNTASYAAQSSWTSNLSFLNFSGGIQIWQVPESGNYTLTAVGAAGGASGVSAGLGSSIQGTFSLNQGDLIKILIGQMGATNSNGSGGGGGGTFVYNQTSSTLLIVAGGGGGAGHTSAGRNAVATNLASNGNPTGGTGGTLSAGGTAGSGYGGAGGGGVNSGNNGAVSGNGLPGGGGGGFGGNGGAAQNNNQSALGKSFLNGGTGGYHNYAAYGSSTAANGGFGGGGTGSSYTYQSGGGGGGGYTGGGGGDGLNVGGGGGGGGSFNSGTSQTNSAGTNSGQGYLMVSFTPRTPATISVELANGLNTTVYRTLNGSRLKATTDSDGYVKFFANGKVIPSCQKVSVSGGVAYCNWVPSLRGSVSITARVTPVASNLSANTSVNLIIFVSQRSNKR